MVRRFHADPIVRSIDFSWQEKVPYDAPLEALQLEDVRATGRIRPAPGQRFTLECFARSPWPEVHFLFQRQYGV